MKQVEFINDHPCGLMKGDQRVLRNAHADRLIEEGFCKVVFEEPESKEETVAAPTNKKKGKDKGDAIENIQL